MRISDWSSDVCSSDLGHRTQAAPETRIAVIRGAGKERANAVFERGLSFRRQAPVEAGKLRHAADADAVAEAGDRDLVTFVEQRGNGRACRVEIGRASCRERVGPYV